MMLKLVCFILVCSSGLSFLINDFSYNTTSSPIHEATNRDLMNLILEEKKFRYQLEDRLNAAEREVLEEKKLRFQLEDRLNAAESKITRMTEYDAAVSSEMEKEKNDLEQLRTQNQMFKVQLANISSDFYKFSSDARKESEDMTIAMHNISSVIEDLKQKLTETNNGTKLNGKAVGFTVYNPVEGTLGTSSSPLKFNSVAFNSNDIFNMSTGEFVCQQPGLYLFIFTLLRSTGNADLAYCHIYKNNSQSAGGLAYASDSDTNSYPSGTGSYLLYLQHGDRVYISGCYNSNHFQTETYFTGCLIQAEN